MANKPAVKPMSVRRKEKKKLFKESFARLGKSNKIPFMPAQMALGGEHKYPEWGKGGRDMAFKSPVVLHQKCQEYFDHVDTNPWYKVEFKGKNAKEVHVPTAVPYTMEGLLWYLGVSRTFWSTFRTGIGNEERYKKLSESDRQTFKVVMEAVEEKIRDRKFGGAAVGAYSANLMTWELGYRQKLAAQATETGTGLNIIVDREEDKSLIESIKEQLQAIDDEHDGK